METITVTDTEGDGKGDGKYGSNKDGDKGRV
ncbi:uncharacterized protein FTOL_13808 [Fusarium torulosum]|uniref:Uncharacterized protein n=1 Tax=Fusarium torulosum TaxID=33205 RepID=A0AAE8MMF8_9HYPO|nr:uncharacterized protein FTOL_13808 [Fusarium torulosum]